MDLQDVVSALRESPFYAGNPDLDKRVKWRAMSNYSILVQADTEEEAEIEWIGQVDGSNKHFNLYIHGDWKPQFAQYRKDFSKTKARGRIVKSEFNAWRDAAEAWDESIEGLKKIQTLKATRGATLQNVIVDAEGGIRIRHSLFEVCPSSSQWDV